MSPRWNDEPGEALRAVRLRVVKEEEEEEEEEDTKTSSALPKREEIIERFGLFGTPRRSNDSDDDEENKKCEMEFTTGTCSNGKTCNRCDRWKRFVDGIGGRAASLTTKKYYEVFTSDLVESVVRHVKERCEEESTKEKVVLLELGARDRDICSGICARVGGCTVGIFRVRYGADARVCDETRRNRGDSRHWKDV